METKKLWLIVGLIIITAAIILRIGTPRNRWICVRGQWLAQGHPKTSQPQTVCRDEFSIDEELEDLSLLVNDSFFTGETSSTDSLPTPVQVEISPTNTPEILPMPETKYEPMVELISPQPDEVMHSPYLITGRAKGNWFFEGKLPLSLRSLDGKIIVDSFAQAQDESMIEDWVDFQAELNFTVSEPLKGELLIKKNNPSGLSEYEAQVSYPVRLAP